GVSSVWSRLAHVPGHAGTAQRRTRQSDRNGIFSRDNADTDCSAQPDTIFRKHRFVFVESLRKVVDELADVFIEVVVSIVGHAADAPRVTRQTRAKLSLKYFQDLFALA